MRSTRRRFVTMMAGAVGSAPIAHELDSWAGGRLQLHCDPSEFNSERIHAQEYMRSILRNSCANTANTGNGVKLKQSENTIECAIDGKPFFVYNYNTKIPDVRRPYFHPIYAPNGMEITQLGEIPGKREKHYHHTGLVIAHQNFTDGNNWQMDAGISSRMEHVNIDHVRERTGQGQFAQRLDWLNKKGDRALIRETRVVTVPMQPREARIIDFDMTFKCMDQPITLNVTPYQIIAVRVPDCMLPKNGGAFTNSEDETQPRDGNPAKWIDASGKLGGDVCGVALFNHPANYKHPTPCLNFANQTIGLSPTHKEPYAFKPGDMLRLRYRVFVHAGDVWTGRVGEAYESYATRRVTA